MMVLIVKGMLIETRAMIYFRFYLSAEYLPQTTPTFLA